MKDILQVSEDLQAAFEVLQKKYGSHSAVARELHIGEDYYCAMRNGRTPITKKNEKYILSEALEAQREMDAVATPPPSPTAGAEAHP